MVGTNPMPPVIFDAPPVAPQGFGLYSAATVFDTAGPTRELGGVEVWPYNCDTGYGTYPAALCWTDNAEAPVKDPGERGAPETFGPTVVYGASECRTDQTEDEVMGRARHNRELHEPQLIESAFASRLLTDAGTPDTAATLVEALGKLEEWLGEQGYNGLIHAARRWSAPAAGLFDDTARGPHLMTHLDNTWVFGGGYGSTLGNTLVATGPVFIWRAAPFERVVTTGSHSVPEFNNTVYGLSERVVTVARECPVYAVTITA